MRHCNFCNETLEIGEYHNLIMTLSDTFCDKQWSDDESKSMFVYVPPENDEPLYKNVNVGFVFNNEDDND